jgi:hypothetical protein
MAAMIFFESALTGWTVKTISTARTVIRAIDVNLGIAPP